MPAVVTLRTGRVFTLVFTASKRGKIIFLSLFPPLVLQEAQNVTGTGPTQPWTLRSRGGVQYRRGGPWTSTTDLVHDSGFSRSTVFLLLTVREPFTLTFTPTSFDTCYFPGSRT